MEPQILEPKEEKPQQNFSIDPEWTRPSGSAVWTKCTKMPSVASYRKLDKKASSPEADEGTLAHYVWQIVNQPELEGFAFPYETGLTEADITEDMKLCASSCNEYISKFCNIEEWKHTAETVIPRFYDPQHNCRADFYCFQLNSDSTVTLHVFDLKYGQWKRVYPDKNPQQAIYGISLLNYLLANPHLIPEPYRDKKIHNVFTHIMQYRQNRWPRYSYQMEELAAFGKEIQDAYNEAVHNQANAKFVISKDTCDNFCPVAAIKDCPGRTFTAINALPDEIRPTEKQTISAYASVPDELIVHYWTKRSEIKKLVDQVEEQMKLRVASGQIKNYVLEKTRGRRYFEDPDEAAAKAIRSLKLKKADVYTTNPPSPNQLDKIIKDNLGSDRLKKKIEELTRYEPGVKIVPIEKSLNPANPTPGFMNHADSPTPNV